MNFVQYERLSLWSPVSRRRRLSRLLLIVALGFVTGGATAQIEQPAPPTASGDPCADGKMFFEARHFLESKDAFETCLKTSGDSIEALIPLTVMAVADERFSVAVDYGRRAVDLAPDNADAHYWYGRALLRSDRVEDAESQWEQGLQLNMGHAGILEALARLALVQGQEAKGYNLLNQLQMQGVDDGWLHRLLSEIAANKGMWNQSLDHLHAAMARDGATVADLLTASQLAIMANRMEEGVMYSRRAADVEPSAATHGALGEAFFAAEQIDSALVYLRLAVEEEPQNPHYHFNLANTLEIIGDYELAEVHFQRYLSLAPQDPVGNFNYGIHLDKQGRVGEAMFHVQEAVRLDPGMLSARVVLAQMYEVQGRFPEAETEILKLMELDPGSQAELQTWLDRIRASAEEMNNAASAGRVRLLHMVLTSEEQVDRVLAALEAGADFAALAVQYSSGPAAARGGDIGWMDPKDMVEPLASAAAALDKNEISPPLEAQGLYHLFKRVH